MAARNDLLGAEIQDLTELMPAEPTDAERGEGAEETDIQALITRSIEAAVNHFRENIEPEMAKATDYYYGRPFGDEKKGRSQVVSTDLRDATLDQIPDLLEIFMGSDSVVEMRPRRPEAVAMAQQATDMINYIFYEENDGFLIMNSVLKDAAVRRLAYVKWNYVKQPRIRGEHMTGISEDELEFLAAEGIEFRITGESMDDFTTQVPDPETGQPVETVQPQPVYEIDILIRDSEEGCYQVEEVPPEEIAWTPEARKFGRAPLIVHHREVPIDELVRMGIPLEFIEEHRGTERRSRPSDSLQLARQFYGSTKGDVGHEPALDETLAESQQTVLFAEAYALVDSETEEGQSELRCFWCVGPTYTIWNGEGAGELVDEVPIALFTQDPEPHTIPGLCNYDYLKEIQRVKSQIQRGTLNSLAQSIEQQLIVTQDVNLRDLVSPEISGVIRARKDTNSVREIKHSFVGPDTLPVLEYYDQIKRDRVGRQTPGESLDPNTMQSTTAEAVSMSFSKAQQRIRMTARVYAETGFKTLFAGIYRMLIKHQKRKKMMRLRGEYVLVDPRYWDADMDCRVNVALGTGSKSQRLADIQALIADQKEHILSGSPLVSYVELRNSYAKATDLMGFKDTDTFYRPWGQEQQQAMEKAMQAAGPQKDAQTRVAEAAELEVQMDAIEAEKKHEAEMLKIRLEDERERMKIQNDYDLGLKKLEVEWMKATKPTPAPSA